MLDWCTSKLPFAGTSGCPGAARATLAALVLLAFFREPVLGENWPGWRGPRATGLSEEPEIPLEWSPTENIAWKVKIPGVGHSSPAVWDDSVFVTGAIPEKQERRLYRLDRRTGTILWDRLVLEAPLEPIHPLNSYASSTPATDGKRVFVTFLDVDRMYVAAFDFDGNLLWETRPGPFASKHGFCTNPVLHGENVILNGDHDGDAYIVSLRQADGKEVWKIPRENKTRSYCTPIIVREGEIDQFMLNGSFCTAGYDARTGKRIWICDGPSEQMVATLVVGHGLIFSLGGFPERHLLAIRRGQTGNLDDQIVWRTHQGIPYVPSPLLYGDLLHVLSDEGFYTCFDPPTGKTLTRKRACKHVSSSLVGGLERVYLTEDDGRTVVIANEPGFRVLAENHLGEEIYSSPAISRGNLFLRGKEHLFCIGRQPEKEVAGNEIPSRNHPPMKFSTGN